MRADEAMRWHVRGAQSAELKDAERRGLDWVVVGGESGPCARSCDVAWIRAIVGQCSEAHVPVFCKQLGSMADEGRALRLHDSKGGDPNEWPLALRVRQFPNGASAAGVQV
jgi:protein gp37